LQELGRPQLPPAVVVSFVGKGLAHLVARCLEATGGTTHHQHSPPLDEALAVALAVATSIASRHYAQMLTRTTKPFDGVVEGLVAMQGMGLKLACVTNKPERFTRPLLARTGLLDYFGAVVSGDSLPEKKPSPEPLYLAADMLGVDRRALLVIGDSANDVAAARNAGVPAWVVPYGYREGMSIEALAADKVVPTLAAAAEALRDILA
jgi:phosphoglycolate phosphatase